METTGARWILSQPWAMLPSMIETMVSVADRTNDIEAVIAKRGEPLDNTRTVQMREGVAVIPVRGPISRYASMFSEISGGTSVDVLARDFRAALDSPEVIGIVLEIDSPGGQAAGIGEIAAMIRAGSKVKPVTAYVSNLGASAALWVASAASRVVMAPSAIMGSMGVVWPCAIPSDKDKARTLEFVSSQSPNKRPDIATDAGRAEMQGVVDSMAQVFIESVASYRKLDPAKAIVKFGKGGLLVGQRAVDAGMADRLGSLESCIEDLSKPKKANMKINLPAFITGLMSRGIKADVDSSEIEYIIEKLTNPDIVEPETVTELEEVAKTLASLETEHSGSADTIETAIASARETWRKEMVAELRAGRIESYKAQAEAFLALNSANIVPAEKENLASAFVAAALLDAENPVEGFSVLGGIKASVTARKPHGQTVEIVTGDAKAIADKLSAENLKTLDSAAGSPADAKAAKDAADFEKLMNSTDEGRAALASMKSAK